MTPKRPKELKWIGKELPDGRPIYFVNDVEPRDYTEQETDALTQDQLKSARDSGLYREVHGSEKQTKVVKNTATKDDDHGQAPGSDAEEVEAHAPTVDSTTTESDGA